MIRLVREFIQACNGEQVRNAPQACTYTQMSNIAKHSVFNILVYCFYFLFFFFFFSDADLCHLFTNHIIKSGTVPIQGIRVLAQAVDKIRLFDSQLTPVHADLCQLSLCAKIFNPVLKFLDIDITAIATTEVNPFCFFFFRFKFRIELQHLFHLLGVCTSFSG